MIDGADLPEPGAAEASFQRSGAVDQGGSAWEAAHVARRTAPWTSVAARVVLVALLAALTYVVRDAPVRALIYLVAGLALVALAAALERRRPRRALSRGQQVRARILLGLGLLSACALALGVVPASDAWVLLVAGEVAAAVVALFALPSLLRAFRASRTAGASWDESLLAALAEVMPPTVRALATAELRVLVAGARLLLPVPRLERGAVRLSYGSGERLLLWVLVPCGLIELVVMDYLLRHTPLRVPVLVLGLLTFPYVLGLLGLSKAYPHLLHGDRLVLRSGPGFALEVPLEQVRRAARRTALVEGPRVARDQAGALTLAHGGQTDLRLELAAPVVSSLGPVTRVDLALDDPRHPALDRLLARP